MNNSLNNCITDPLLTLWWNIYFVYIVKVLISNKEKIRKLHFAKLGVFKKKSLLLGNQTIISLHSYLFFEKTTF